jgi:serine/threonine-protein kinase
MLAHMESLPRFLDPRYRLDARIGQGGMAMVYRGFDVQMARPVAIKLIYSSDSDDIDESVMSRFLREARHTARLRHEHIVEVYDLGKTEGGEVYFVMELLPGETLSTILRTQGRMQLKDAIHVGIQVCEALHVAHIQGIIHRDLKPANIMVFPRAHDPLFAKVLDFGVAKALGSVEERLTRTGMLVGTIEYMAPEQIIGRPVDGRTDVYSFGMLLYRLITGTPVFQTNAVPALINAHLSGMPQPMSTRCPEARVPPELDRVVRKCLEKNPLDRYASMIDVSHELARFEGDPLASLPMLGAADDEAYAEADRTHFMGRDLAGEKDSEDNIATQVMHKRPVIVRTPTPMPTPAIPLPPQRPQAATRIEGSGGRARAAEGGSARPEPEPGSLWGRMLSWAKRKK